MRDKNDYHHALRKARICREVPGCKSWDGVLGKLDKGKIHYHDDGSKTNSEWYGKRNFKHSDMQRFKSTVYSLENEVI